MGYIDSQLENILPSDLSNGYPVVKCQLYSDFGKTNWLDLDATALEEIAKTLYNCYERRK